MPQEVLLSPIPEGAHLHPHRSEALQVSLRRMYEGIPLSRKALPAQEDSREQDLLSAEGQAEGSGVHRYSEHRAELTQKARGHHALE